jgi:hypothetical protein
MPRSYKIILKHFINTVHILNNLLNIKSYFYINLKSIFMIILKLWLKLLIIKLVVSNLLNKTIMISHYQWDCIKLFKVLKNIRLFKFKSDKKNKN